MPEQLRVVLNPCDNSEQCRGRPVQLIVPLMGGEYATRLSQDEARQLGLELVDMSRRTLAPQQGEVA